MLQLHRNRTIVTPFLAVALIAGACQSGKTADKGAATGENITKAADGIQAGIGQLDATLTALTNLVDQPAPDLDPQYKSFSKHLDELDSTAKKVRGLAEEMGRNGKAYVAEWDKQVAAIQNEDIKARTAERRQMVEKNLKEIQDQYAEARDGFRPLMNDLMDIRTALGADLTMSGIDAVKKSAKKASKEGAEVKESMQKLADRFREVGVKLSKAGPPPPAAPEKK